MEKNEDHIQKGAAAQEEERLLYRGTQDTDRGEDQGARGGTCDLHRRIYEGITGEWRDRHVRPEQTRHKREEAVLGSWEVLYMVWNGVCYVTESH